MKFENDLTKSQPVIKTLFGYQPNPKLIAKAAGALPNSSVGIYPTTYGTGARSLIITTKSPALETVRRVYTDNGRLTLSHDSQVAHPSIRGQGHKRFHDVINAAQKIGISKIHIPEAVGSPDTRAEGGNSGYHVWPSYGFNGKLEPIHISRLPSHIKKKLTEINGGSHRGVTLHQLFSIPGAEDDKEQTHADEELGGRGAWSRHGLGVYNLNFELNSKSEHMKRWNEYYQKRLDREKDNVENKAFRKKGEVYIPMNEMNELKKQHLRNEYARLRDIQVQIGKLSEAQKKELKKICKLLGYTTADTWE